MKYLMIFCVLFGCKKSADQAAAANEPEVPGAVTAAFVKYLALGDSYTIGESVASDERFPSQLSARLDKEKKIKMTGTKVVARTGWTTADLQNALDGENIKDTFDLVTLLIGVNDQYQHKDTGSYATNFEDLLRRAIIFAGGRKERVFVVSIPDYGYTPFGEGDQQRISRELDIFNAINERISLQYGISRFDITPISRSGKAGLVASDGLHPSAEQYRLWVDLMYEKIKNSLIN